MEQKIVKRIERVFKGMAHQKRVRILEFIAKQNKTALWQISQGLDIELRNTSHHTDMLEKAGLIEKHQSGLSVYHELTPYGQRVVEFIKNLE